MNLTREMRPALAGSLFNVTAWFKRGELQQELAEETAAAGSVDPLTGPAPASAVPDNPTLTSLDTSRLSLQGDDKAAAPAEASMVVPGARMSDQELFSEAAAVHDNRVVLVAGVGMIVVVATACAFLMG